VGAVTLVDAAQSAGHLPIDVQALGCDFPSPSSGHKMCGTHRHRRASTGAPSCSNAIAAVARAAGEMILSVSLETSSYKKLRRIALRPARRISADGGGGSGAGGRLPSQASAANTSSNTICGSRPMPWSGSPSCQGCALLGPRGARGSLAGFVMDGAHPHDLTTYGPINSGSRLRGGHHCNQTADEKVSGCPAPRGASFYFLQHPRPRSIA